MFSVLGLAVATRAAASAHARSSRHSNALFVLSERVHGQLFDGLVAVVALGDRNRLDGVEWCQFAVSLHWTRENLAQRLDPTRTLVSFPLFCLFVRRCFGSLLFVYFRALCLAIVSC